MLSTNFSKTALKKMFNVCMEAIPIMIFAQN